MPESQAPATHEQAADISVLIVTYNSALVITECLDSIRTQTGVLVDVWVIDNASEDRTVELIETDYHWVNLIKNSDNMGFGKANNQALRQIKSRYVYFLNPDAQLTPGTLATIIRHMEHHPEIGLAGTSVVYPDGSIQSSVEEAYPGQRQTGGELDGLPGAIACVQGSSMIMLTPLARQIGGFDEDYFLYGEDQDLCLRVRRQGREIGFVAEAVVRHIQGHTERVSGFEILWQRKIRAEYLFYRKHYSPASLRRIRTAHFLKAAWVLSTQWVLSPFVSKTPQRQERLFKYRAILQHALA